MMVGASERLRRLVRFDSRADAEPSTELFSAIRWRLILWYSGVLAVALLLSGVVLYLGVRHSLLDPIQQDLQQNARVLGASWQITDERFPRLGEVCPSDDFEHLGFGRSQPLFVCFDTHGRLMGESRIVADLPRTFSSSGLVRPAIRNGQSGDIVDAGGPLGMVQRYALRVPTAQGQGTLGVIQVGEQVGPQLQALDTLLHLLLVLGALTLLFAAVAGLFLANRALLPARVAHARQRDFIADASHELRTPLTMLRSNVEVVLRGRNQLQPEDVALLEDTVLEARHLASLANSMLDLARLDAGEAHLEREVVDLRQLSDEVVRWAGAFAAEHDLTISAEQGEPVLVVGDRPLLEQAALILIENAIKYNRPGGQVTVRAWTEDHQAHLEVRDTGIGIADVHMSRLGDRFYRVDKARSRESGGAGLGLSIVRGIVARHAGSFRLASDPGHGTAASISLPAAEARIGSSATA